MKGSEQWFDVTDDFQRTMKRHNLRIMENTINYMKKGFEALTEENITKTKALKLCDLALSFIEETRNQKEVN